MNNDRQVLINFFTELSSDEDAWDDFRQNHVGYVEENLPNHENLWDLLLKGEVEGVLDVLDGAEIRQPMVVIW